MANPRAILDDIMESSMAVCVFDETSFETLFQNALSRQLFGPLSDLYGLKKLLQQDRGAAPNLLKSIKTLACAEGLHTFLLRNHCRDGMLVYLLEDVTTLGMELEGLRQSVTHDPLTRSLNRRAILEVLDNQIGRGERYGEPSWIMLFDLDHFKRVNDTYGHLAGDAVLARVTEVAEGTLRKSDRIGRYGGEEFLLVLPHTNAAGGFRTAERLRTRVEAHAFRYEQLSIDATISIGMSGYQRGDTAEALIKRCDQALYQAKARGRNRAEFQ